MTFIYQELLEYVSAVSGDVVEVGTNTGGSLLSFLRAAVVMPQRPLPRTIGFDKAGGFPDVDERDGGLLPAIGRVRGGYGGRDHFDRLRLSSLAALHDIADPVAFTLVEGDVHATISRYLADHERAYGSPLRIKLLHLDVDTYAATLVALELLAPHLERGALLLCDQLRWGDRAWGGELAAMRDYWGSAMPQPLRPGAFMEHPISLIRPGAVSVIAQPQLDRIAERTPAGVTPARYEVDPTYIVTTSSAELRPRQVGDITAAARVMQRGADAQAEIRQWQRSAPGAFQTTNADWVGGLLKSMRAERIAAFGSLLTSIDVPGSPSVLFPELSADFLSRASTRSGSARRLWGSVALEGRVAQQPLWQLPAMSLREHDAVVQRMKRVLDVRDVSGNIAIVGQSGRRSFADYASAQLLAHPYDTGPRVFVFDADLACSEQERQRARSVVHDLTQDRYFTRRDRRDLIEMRHGPLDDAFTDFFRNYPASTARPTLSLSLLVLDAESDDVARAMRRLGGCVVPGGQIVLESPHVEDLRDMRDAVARCLPPDLAVPWEFVGGQTLGVLRATVDATLFAALQKMPQTEPDIDRSVSQKGHSERALERNRDAAVLEVLRMSARAHRLGLDRLETSFSISEELASKSGMYRIGDDVDLAGGVDRSIERLAQRGLCAVDDLGFVTIAPSGERRALENLREGRFAEGFGSANVFSRSSASSTVLYDVGQGLGSTGISLGGG
jgi:hypothetical protein